MTRIANTPNRRLALLALALLLPAAGALAQARPPACANRIAIVNEAARPVQELFLRASGSAGWGADRLGDTVLRPGASFELTPDIAGMVDLMTLTPDGAARVLTRLDACAVRRVTLTAAMTLRAE